MNGVSITLTNDWRAIHPGVRWIFLQCYIGRGWFFMGLGFCGFAIQAEAGMEKFHREYRSNR